MPGWVTTLKYAEAFAMSPKQAQSEPAKWVMRWNYWRMAHSGRELSERQRQLPETKFTPDEWLVLKWVQNGDDDG